MSEPSLKAIGIYSTRVGITHNALIWSRDTILRGSEWKLKELGEGPLTTVFGGPTAKVLDQVLYVGNMEQSIPMLAESTGLTYKTVQKAVLRLNKLGLIKRSRKIGSTQTYRFDAGNDLHELIMWAEHLKIKR